VFSKIGKHSVEASDGYPLSKLYGAMDGGVQAPQGWAEGACFERGYPFGAASELEGQALKLAGHSQSKKPFTSAKQTRGATWT